MANHLGLVDAIEQTLGFKLPIVNCCKCFTFHSTLIYTLVTTHCVIHSFAVSFLMALVALWFDVSLGILDNLYYKAYEYTYGNTAASDDEDATTGNTHAKDTQNPMP